MKFSMGVILSKFLLEFKNSSIFTVSYQNVYFYFEPISKF